MPYNGQLFIWTGQNTVHLFDYLGLKNKQTGGGGGGGGGNNNNKNVPNKPRGFCGRKFPSLINLTVSVDVSSRPK